MKKAGLETQARRMKHTKNLLFGGLAVIDTPVCVLRPIALRHRFSPVLPLSQVDYNFFIILWLIGVFVNFQK